MGAIFVCIVTRATSGWIMTDYSTYSLLMAVAYHASIYGAPRLVVTDRGTQIVAAAGGQPEWNAVQHRTARLGTSWRFIPPAAPWHNGAVERIIGMLKRTIMREVHSGALLDLCQMQVLLHKCTFILNERPLSARSFSLEDFCSRYYGRRLLS